MSSKGSPMPSNDSMSSVAQWVQQQNANLEQGAISSPPNPHMPQSHPDSFSPPAVSFPPNPNVPHNPNAPWPDGAMPPHDVTSPDGINFPPNGPPTSFPGGPGAMGPNGPNNLSVNKVPNENLTPEQLSRRVEHLTSLRNLEKMLGLSGEQRNGQPGPNGPGPGPPHGPPGGMMGPNGPPGMPPGMQHPNMPPHSGMMSPGMMPMSMNGPGPPMGPGFGPHPGQLENLTPAQRDWVKMQHEFAMEKRHKQEMERMQRIRMGMPPGHHMPPGMEGHPFMQMRGMRPPMSPTSPSFPHGDPRFMLGPRRPGPHMFEPMGPVPGGFDMMRHPMKNSQPRMQFVGNPEPFNPDMLPQHNAGPPGPTKPPPPYGQSQKRKRPAGDDLDEMYKKLQPAPSPQQFSYLNQFEGQELTITKQLNAAYQEPKTDCPPAHNQPVTSAAHNAGAQTRKNVAKSQHGSQPHTPLSQPSLSPRQPSMRTTTPAPTSGIASPSLTSRPNSRPSSRSGVTLTSSQSNLPVRSPRPASVNKTAAQQQQQQQQHQQHGSVVQVNSQVAAATQRLSHFDPSMTSASMTQQTMMSMNKSSTMSNITSASLANLAKGVEHLSNQMQQSMVQGGPFHNIQLQQQMPELQDGRPPPNSQPPNAPRPPSNQGPHPQANMPPGGHPQVNNTFVNANVSIGQVNIQSGGGHHPGVNNNTYNASMQVQQMSTELQQQHQQHGPNGPQQSVTSMSQQQMSHQMTSQHSSGHNAPMQPPHSNEPMIPTQFAGAGRKTPHSAGIPPQRPFPGQSPQLPGDVLANSPGFPRSSANPLGNTNVQIQAKAPNTIQYLPAHPPSSQAGAPPSSAPPPMNGPLPPMSANAMMPPRKDMDPMYMSPRFSPPGLDGGLPPPRGKFFGHPPGGPHMSGPMGPNDMMHRMPHGTGPQGPMMQQTMMVPNSMMHQQMGGPVPNGPMDGPMGPMCPPEMMHGQMPMQAMHMHGPGGPPMMRGGPPMRPEMMGGGPHGPGFGQSSNFLQFQQQLYAQGRPQHMNPAMGGPRMPGMHDPHMMGGPGMMPGMGPPDMGPRGLHPGMMPGPMPGPGGMGGAPGMMGIQ